MPKPNSAKIIASGLRPSPDAALRAIRNQFPYLLERLSTADPIYCLPEQLISALRAPHRASIGTLSRIERDAEAAFCNLCRQYSAIGFWQSRPVAYPLLATLPLPPFQPGELRVSWSTSQATLTESLTRKTAEIRLRLKGYVGWLVLDPEFRQHRDQLKQTWSTLPRQGRPSFPLGKVISVPGVPAGFALASVAVGEFATQWNAFLDRWGLVGMATWDLPEPQGPLIPAPVKRQDPAMPKHGLHIVLPFFYAVMSDDLLLAEIRQQQQQLAEGLHIDPAVAGLPKFEAHSTMFDVFHLESVLRSRIGRLNRGAVLIIENVLADALQLELSYLQKLRRAISAILRGKRASVRWLKTKR